MSDHWKREEREDSVAEVVFAGNSKLAVLEDDQTGRWCFGLDGMWSDDTGCAEHDACGLFNTPAEAKRAAIETLRSVWQMLDSLPGVPGEVVVRDYELLEALEAELAPDPNQAWLFGPFDEHAPESVKALTSDKPQ